jgi:hypothetical protein
MIGLLAVDHRDIAEQQLGQADPHTIGNPAATLQSALAHALIGLCDRLDELSVVVAIPKSDEDEDDA